MYGTVPRYDQAVSNINGQGLVLQQVDDSPKSCVLKQPIAEAGVNGRQFVAQCFLESEFRSGGRIKYGFPIADLP